MLASPAAADSRLFDGWEQSAFIRAEMARYAALVKGCGLTASFPGLDNEAALAEWLALASACVTPRALR